MAYQQLNPVPSQELSELMNKSNVFPNPLSANRVATLISSDPKCIPLVEKAMTSVRPIVHQRVFDRLVGLFNHMTTHDNPEVRAVYANRTDQKSIISRLLQHRPVVFFTEEDAWTCLDKSSGKGWHVGEPNVHVPSVSTHMTYDEIKFAALIGLSSFSIFINDGRRDNMGTVDAAGSFIHWGVIIGAVGARFEIPGRMDWEECVVTPGLSVEANGYGQNADNTTRITKWRRLWAEIYELPHLPTWNEALQDQSGRFKQISKFPNGGALLDSFVYLKRMRMQAEVLLLEASDRGLAENRKVYLHVVGLGLGVWQISDDQNILFGQAWTEAINALNLQNIAVVDFSWIKNVQMGVVPNQTGTQIIFSQRSPHALLHDPNMLLVEIFAWDGNSFPGNEYWLTQLAASGDPAAAASSIIGEVHNPQINARVCGDSTQVFPRAPPGAPYQPYPPPPQAQASHAHPPFQPPPPPPPPVGNAQYQENGLSKYQEIVRSRTKAVDELRTDLFRTREQLARKDQDLGALQHQFQQYQQSATLQQQELLNKKKETEQMLQAQVNQLSQQQYNQVPAEQMQMLQNQQLQWQQRAQEAEGRLASEQTNRQNLESELCILKASIENQGSATEGPPSASEKQEMEKTMVTNAEQIASWDTIEFDVIGASGDF